MNKKTAFSSVLGMAILLTVAVAVPMDFGQTADATKSKGNSLPEVGSKKVCGDRLYSEIPPEERKSMTKSQTAATSTTPNDIESLFEIMDSVHKKHQSEMAQMWKTMTPQEQSKMFQNMEQMISKMESMKIGEHMQMMKNMMQDKSHMGHDQQKMKDMMMSKKTSI